MIAAPKSILSACNMCKKDLYRKQPTLVHCPQIELVLKKNQEISLHQDYDFSQTTLQPVPQVGYFQICSFALIDRPSLTLLPIIIFMKKKTKRICLLTKSTKIVKRVV